MVKHADISRKQEVMLWIMEIEKNIDKCIASDVEKQERLDLLKECDELTNLEDMDMVQKARIKWEVEGDKNSNFFHEMLKEKGNQQMVKGLMIDGEWVTDPHRLKLAFFIFYKEKIEARDTLELFKPDVEAAVSDFFNHFVMPKGANSSFITLILKVSNPIHIKDFCPISLIGMYYKIIAKILTNRLAKVVDKGVSPEQSVFISSRQILDEPLMLSKLVAWYKRRNHKLMMFKVDFEKAYDTVSWKFLDRMLSTLGFGSKWRRWIQLCLQTSRSSVLVNGSPSIEFLISRGSLAFIYLGLPIGSNMNLIANWQFMIDRFRRKLSTWKANMLSIGGRFTLIKAVLWSLAIHGDDTGMELKGCNFSGTWANIIDSFSMLHNKYIIPLHTLRHKVGNGSSICFWKDNWIGNGPLSTRYNRLFHLDANPNCMLVDRLSHDTWTWNWKRQLGSRNEESLEILKTEIGHVQINDCPDSWHWNGGDDGVFSVSVLHVDNFILPSLSPSTRWYKILPRKINIFIWRLILDILPNSLNLSLRDLDIQSITCPSCNVDLESNDHIFFGCDTTSSIWRLIRVWIDVSMPSFVSCSDWFQWLEGWGLSKDYKDRVYVISVAALWILRRYRNNITFNYHPMRKSDLFYIIRMFSFS
nr:RNA-directed DNA polymerase, eukaryota [Tanacetum cinerariifolium]